MIHLVQMPFGSITTPSLALGQFKAQLHNAGIEARVFPFNMTFARMIGIGAYETIARFKGVETQIGEWLFAKEAWQADFGLDEQQFLQTCGDEIDGIPHVTDLSAWLSKVKKEVVPVFLDQCIDRLVEAGELQVVAFSCSFFQTIASLALGRRIRERFPNAKLIYGGACFHGEMGQELTRAATWIDASSTGEADNVIVELCQALLEGRVPKGLQGILYREIQGGDLQSDVPHQAIDGKTMDSLPVPDFDDFFQEAKRVGYFNDSGWLERILIPFESARGCWWGQKQHCTFCGLNGDGMNYRSRSAEKILELLHALAERYPWVKRYQAADNIMPMSYFHDVLPKLAENPPRADVEYFWTVKSNMRRSQIQQLAAAHVRYLQPGIESLSDNILKHMHKGVTALQNVCFLRTCQEEGVTVYWNNLIRIPGETAEDYAQMVAWLPLLSHLRPAYGGTPKVECHRFSPYFFQTECWTTNLQPMRWYQELYPSDKVDIRKVAYYYQADWKDVLEGNAYDQLLIESAKWTAAWRESDAAPSCIMKTEQGTLYVKDSRFGSPIQHQLDPITAQVLLALDTPSSKSSLQKNLPDLSLEQIDTALEMLLINSLVLSDGYKYLCLVLREGTSDLLPWQRAGLLKRITNQQPVGETSL